MEKEGREELRQAWMLPPPPPSVVENYRRVGLHQIQQEANPESYRNNLVYVQVI